MFHFNKAHLTDQTIPMWVLKFHGETLYVNHVDCTIPWSTKETPDNSHTKGSIKVKDCLLTVDDENNATLSKLTIVDKVRLRNQKLGVTRVIVSGQHINTLRTALKAQNVKHSPIKSIGGACTTTFYITDITDKAQFTMLSLVMGNTDFRILKPNESYYKVYDDPKYHALSDIDLDAAEWDDD